MTVLRIQPNTASCSRSSVSSPGSWQFSSPLTRGHCGAKPTAWLHLPSTILEARNKGGVEARRRRHSRWPIDLDFRGLPERRKRMTELLKKLIAEDAGQDMAEYGIALAVVGLVAALAALAIANNVGSLWSRANSIISTASNP